MRRTTPERTSATPNPMGSSSSSRRIGRTRPRQPRPPPASTPVDTTIAGGPGSASAWAPTFPGPGGQGQRGPFGGSRGFERGAVVGPAAGLGVVLVGGQDEGVDVFGEVVAAGELASAQDAAGEGGEEDLHLVQP